MTEEYEILDPSPNPTERPKPFFEKYGPAILLAALVTLPAMNLTASVVDYRTAKLNLRIAELQDAAEEVTR